MAAILERRVTHAAGWSRRFASFSFVLFVIAGLAHRQRLLETAPFAWVLAIVAACAILGLLLSAYAFSRLWKYDDIGGRDLTIGLLVAALVLAPFAVTAYRGLTLPKLNDITTDPEDPPRLSDAIMARTADMNRIEPVLAARAKLQTDAYPAVTGRRYDLPFERTLEAVNAVIGRQDWVLDPTPPAETAQGEVTIEALAYTMILAFPVDVAIRVTDEDGSTYVDMRSASRYGPHDFGDNAGRIVAFLAELDTEIAGLVGTVPAAVAD